ncbi:MAG TPA: dihydrofolate reductase family protein [Chthoniobacterales bacterium]|nr:dihydrofolate reductase family protein [Chthoniobacterales bacterium]
MRKVTFGVANSLDNYIARENHAVDWLTWTKETAQIMAKYWKKIDTAVMGRKTYEVALRLNKGNANPYPEVKCYVLSRTLPPGPKRDNVEIVSEDAVKFVRKLKRAAGKEICVLGGGELAKPLFEARLIDEIGFNIHPVLLGKGIPLFHQMKRQIDLELRECRRLTNGCVLVRYRVKN